MRDAEAHSPGDRAGVALIAVAAGGGVVAVKGAPHARSRRRFLGGALATISVAFLPGCTLPVIPGRPEADVDAAQGWIRHDGQGRFTLMVPRVEMGQQITTALKQIACIELGVDWHAVTTRMPSTDEITPVRATVGSESVQDFAVPLAQACATLRDALDQGIAQSAIQPRERPLEALRAFRRNRPEPPRNRSDDAARTPVAEHLEDLVRGQPLFASDVRRPGMLYGRVLRAPVSPEIESSPGAMDETAARQVPGFVAIVRDAGLILGRAHGVGIVARTPAALDRIERALAPSWSVDGSFDAGDVRMALDIDKRIGRRERREHHVRDEPMPDTGDWSVDLRIDVPAAAHAALEPRVAVAEDDAGQRMQIWVGTQDAFYERAVVARRLGRDSARVIVRPMRIGGAFGGKTIPTVAFEAAVLADAVRAPVKVQWTREQEFVHGFHRPPSSHRVRARVHRGRVSAWRHDFASGHVIFTNAGLPPWLQALTDFVGDPGVARGAAPPYVFGASRIGFDLVRLPVLTGPWRGLGAGPNGLVVESAMDECARAVGEDPLAFRLAHAGHPRLKRVLEAVARMSGWPGRSPSRDKSAGGFGVACGIYKERSFVAVVARVRMPVSAGARPVVTGMWCAHDSGLVVNPDQVRAQCEGNLVWGLGMALHERLEIGRSRVRADNFDGYPIPRIADVPPLEIALVGGDHPPGGAGETAIVAAAAAVSNAVRDVGGGRAAGFPIGA